MSFRSPPTLLDGILNHPFDEIRLQMANPPTLFVLTNIFHLSLSSNTPSLHWSDPGYNQSPTMDLYLSCIKITRVSDGVTRKIEINREITATMEEAGEMILSQSLAALVRVSALGDLVSVELRQKTIPKLAFSQTGTICQSLDNFSANDLLFLFPGGKRLWYNSRALIQASPYYQLMFESGFAEASPSYLLNPFPLDMFKLESGKSEKQESIPAGTAEKVKQDGKLELATSKMKIVEEVEEEEEEENSDSDFEPDSISVVRKDALLPIHKIVIRDASYKTFKALLFFISTSKLDFAPLRSTFSNSTSPPASVPEDITFTSPPNSDSSPAPVSPKSIYKLAHKLEIASLSKLALENYTSQLHATNALHELFSDITIYPEIKEAAIAACLDNWSSISGGSELQGIEARLERGELSSQKMALALELFRKLKPV